MDGEVQTEVPTDLQKLVRMVVRGFYSTEDMLIVDMLVRNRCLSEDDICKYLKFDRKMLRQRMNTLKTDKLLQTKMRMVTGEDGKSQREQYYYINYKSFVNVVKYKLDHIRKKLEMEEREQTSRASFICHNCQRTYTDLEADQLLDMNTGQLVCIICRTEVQEDMAATPRQDSRLLLTRFNEQLEPLFTLLMEVENIKLSADCSDPRPVDLSNGKPTSMQRGSKSNNDSNRSWSGDATKRSGFQVEGTIDINVDTEQQVEEVQKAKEEPAWLSQASSFITAQVAPETTEVEKTIPNDNNRRGDSHSASHDSSTKTDSAGKDDVLLLLQAHEPKSKRNAGGGEGNDSDSDASVEETSAHKNKKSMPFMQSSSGFGSNRPPVEVDLSDDDDFEDDDKDDNVPLINVGNQRIPINAVDNTVIAKMTQQEKNLYINAYQEYMAGMEDL